MGSYKLRENAEKFRQELIKYGYKGAVILRSKKGFFRVSLGGFDTPKQTIQTYNDYLSRFPDKQAWLIINDLSNGKN